MTRTSDERAAFRDAPDRVGYLRANSRLPGPRANLELLAAAAEEVEFDWARRWATVEAISDPTDVFVISVGLVALGRAVAEGDDSAVQLLRARASDREWRIRESVAIALQRVGDADLALLERIARDWSTDDALVQRAAVAAVAEPRLLRDGRLVAAALYVVDAATRTVRDAADPAESGVRVLRQALGYAWSVIVAADPAVAWPRFTAWMDSGRWDVEWIVGENLKKDRLMRLGLTRPPS